MIIHQTKTRFIYFFVDLYLAMHSNANNNPHILQLQNTLLNYFGFDPTVSQQRLIHAMSRFLHSQMPNCLLMIKGYAGTGKTSMVNALVKTLPSISMRSVLLAPTGRAAKVLSSYSNHRAFTIHKKIYFQERLPSGAIKFVKAQNLHTHTVFVVDEASMIGWEDYSAPGGGNLLLDLFDYVFSGHNCRLILIGDGAQLPPVGSNVSPALDLDFLKSEFSLTAAICELTDVMRQREDSGILALATAIRNCVQGASMQNLPLRTPPLPDVVHINGIELPEYLEELMGKYGPEGCVIVSRSNKRCNAFNQAIRTRVFYREENISTGDYVMAVKNNYHWLEEDNKAGFIANGDVMEILRIGKHIERYGYHFIYVTARMIDYPDEAPVEMVLWIDSLMYDGPSMGNKDWEKLYHGVLEDYMHLSTKAERKKAVKNDPLLNAVQVKFAYAITCHKAQGGQWPAVIVDQGYITDEMIDEQYFRWLYTAVTRASEKLYLLNFDERVIAPA